MAKATNKGYPEIEDIRHDLDSLRNNVVELTKHVTKDGDAKVEDLKKVASERWEEMAKDGKKRLAMAESRVKEKPAQSLAIAFAAGALLSMLMKR